MKEKIKNKKEMNKQVIIIVTSVIATVLSTIGVSFAAFVWSDISQKEQNVVVGNLKLEISSNSEPLGSNLEIPIKDGDVDTLTPYTFKVTNTGEVDAYFKVKIVDDYVAIESDECTDKQIDKQYIGLKVTEGIELTGLLSEYNNIPIDFGVLKPTEEKTYKLYLWLKDGLPNDEIEKHYHGKILLETEQTIDNERMLSKAILEDNALQIQAPTFTEESQDKGLFKMTNDIASVTEPIYYYRGAVENNYVSFGTHTKDVKSVIFGEDRILRSAEVAKEGEPMLWRIVRINGDGSIKLIAENNIGDSYHVWSSKSVPDYVNKDENENETPSDIKKTIDDWYEETFETTTGYPENKELSKLVKKTEFCNDRSSDYNAVKSRLNQETPQPTLKCENSEDIVKAKAGLITADEIIYAGALYSKTVTNGTTFLNNNTFFFTMSPINNNLVANWSCYDMSVGYAITNISNVGIARPVITLAPGVVVTTDFLSKDALGTKNNPYKVVVK